MKDFVSKFYVTPENIPTEVNDDENVQDYIYFYVVQTEISYTFLTCTTFTKLTFVYLRNSLMGRLSFANVRLQVVTTIDGVSNVRLQVVITINDVSNVSLQVVTTIDHVSNVRLLVVTTIDDVSNVRLLVAPTIDDGINNNKFN